MTLIFSIFVNCCMYLRWVNGEVFDFGMVYWVHGDLYVIFIVTIYGHCQNISHAKFNKSKSHLPFLQLP
jgi:hypothetical protein